MQSIYARVNINVRNLLHWTVKIIKWTIHSQAITFETIIFKSGLGLGEYKMFLVLNIC